MTCHTTLPRCSQPGTLEGGTFEDHEWGKEPLETESGLGCDSDGAYAGPCVPHPVPPQLTGTVSESETIARGLDPL